MNRSIMFRLLGIVAAAAALSGLGCSSLGPAAVERTPEEIVTERAAARWSALLRGDTATAYQYLSPAYRAVVSPELYRGRFGGGIRWREIEAVTADCAAERCDVGVVVKYEAPRWKIVNSRKLEEVWILVDGQWWLHQRH
jgi:hypothetical protein